MEQARLNIVVVEDEAIIAEQLMMTLQSLGFRPWGPAMTLQEAKGYVARGPADLVLIDIHLQEKHDGIELGQYLKRQNRIPHVYVTANADSGTVELAKQTTPMGFIVKPFQASNVYSSIEVAMANWELMHPAALDQHVEVMDDDINYNHELRVLFVTVNGNQVRLFTYEIAHVRSAHVYVEFHMQNRDVHVVRTSMNKVEDTLPPDRFVRVHRSHLVNISYAEHFDGRQLTVHGKKIPVSKTNKKRLVDRFPSLRDRV
ncbi:MAG: LytTR family transcriptional regulator DNA-binding domain-containing protein [Bacteroidetes bacterium]|nr:LytTR family transcriptional regulator DNA-binding domain-containing protein [Bacteroidota bacterium]MDA0904271.1 LytTR family transcriptional regulator DNA-binding domain-containing protein [Bacteroidota bacterium]MDA1241867.1 LytTR family transcriptional regulator DNA-binding domain-containing protein [Bacteroidota bacterium]